MDKVSIADPGEEIFDFGGLQMRRLATVPLPLTSLLGGLRRQPYTEQPVRRTTVYGWDQGREVYELVAPDGTTYVMQSYSLQVDPTLTEADLPTLGARLQLPEGWRYRVRRLEEEWSLAVDGEARVVQDELENSYQRVEPSSPESRRLGKMIQVCGRTICGWITAHNAPISVLRFICLRWRQMERADTVDEA